MIKVPAEQSLRDDDGVANSMVITPLTALRAIGASMLVAVAACGVTETDIWGHLRFGLDILSSRSLPHFDSYSFTSTQPWVNHEWGSQIILAMAYRAGGLPLLALVRVSAIVGLTVLVSRSLRQTAWPLRDGALAGVLLAAVPILRTARPQVFSLPLYALTLSALFRDAWWLPLVFLAWANLHGGWMIGLGAVAVNTACRPTIRRVGILAACALATLVNPYHVHLWLSLLDAVRRGWSEVIEWQPVYAYSWGSDIAITWLLTAAVSLWAAFRSSSGAFHRIWTVIVAFAALRASRHVPFFAITTAMLLLARVSGRPAEWPTLVWDGRTRATVIGSAIGGGLAAWTLFVPTLTCLPRAQPPLTPDSGAVAFIRAADLRGRVLIFFDWGLYAIWQVGDRLKVSIDNRRETVYSAQVVDGHHLFYEGHNPEYPRRLAADYVWVPLNLPAIPQLHDSGWYSIYSGSRSVILSRVYAPTATGGDGLAPCFPAP